MHKWLILLVFSSLLSLNSLATPPRPPSSPLMLADVIQYLVDTRSTPFETNLSTLWGRCATCFLMRGSSFPGSTTSQKQDAIQHFREFAEGFKVYAAFANEDAEGVLHIRDATEKKRILVFAHYLMLEDHFRAFLGEVYLTAREGDCFTLANTESLTFQEAMQWLSLPVVREALLLSPLFASTQQLENALRTTSSDSFANAALIKAILNQLNTVILETPALKEGFASAAETFDKERAQKKF